MTDDKVQSDLPTLRIVDDKPDEFNARDTAPVVPEIVDDVARFMGDMDRCGARTAIGGTCGQPVVGPHATVCRVHGGSAPQVREAAIARLRTARDSALDQLVTVLSSDGNQFDPRTLLDIVTKLTDKVELLEGRATARTETAEFKLEEVRATFKVKLDALADSYKRAPSVLDMVDRMMGEGKYATDEEDDAADG